MFGLFEKKENENTGISAPENGVTTEARPQRETLEITPAITDNARLVLLEILQAMGLSVDVAVKESKENTIALEITGAEDLGIVIGKAGSTLHALQLLLSNILSKKYQKKAFVHLDANDYKVKQEQQIIASAADAADVAERENVQIVLDPMTSAERRIVHTALQDRPGVETFSRGVGRMRQVVVSPKDFKKDKSE
ncbi:putative RNA-binding protein Jag [Candidatus Termititenax dinenymphae]|uniref:RNA-binding protein Jag n=1 Tax=Candidatus Termititenax dinenymphae TaxID=2218523 RepID=A0A388TL82_9BACT|nr:putative RNA-binding protein Jag [Candidatus Termititenax dinenymphae]